MEKSIKILKSSRIIYLIGVLCLLIFYLLPGKAHYHITFISILIVLLNSVISGIYELKNRSFPSEIFIFGITAILFSSFFFDKVLFGSYFSHLTAITLVVLLDLFYKSFFKIKKQNFNINFFKQDTKLYCFVGSISIVLSVVSFILFFNSSYLQFVISVILLLNFSLNRTFFLIKSEHLNNILKLNEYTIESPEIYKKTAEVRTIVFDKNIIIKNEKIIVKSEFRKTIKQETILNALYCLMPELRNEQNVNFQNFEQQILNNITLNDFSISGVNENNSIFNITTQFPENENIDFTHILFKDDILIAKFNIQENPKQEYVELIDKLNKEGFNTTILCTDNETNCSKIAGFDKYYSKQTKNQQIEIVKQLQIKANTAYIGENKEIAEFSTIHFKNNLQVFEILNRTKISYKKLVNKRTIMILFHVMGISLLWFFPFPELAIFLTLFFKEIITRNL